MAYITIPGDSDGDLHDAAMHNSKFGAIASVLNATLIVTGKHLLHLHEL